MKKQYLPPKWVNRLLAQWCKAEMLEEIEGDLLEYYQIWREKYTPRKANLLYVLHVLKFLRPFAMKKPKALQSNFSSMLQHALLISFRGFKRYKSSFLINLAGLSTAFACVLLSYLWINDELLMDKFHENEANIHLVMTRMDFGNSWQTTENTSGLLGPLLLQEMPEVIKEVRVAKHMKNSTLSHNEKIVKADGHYVTDDFFQVFSFPLIHGDKDNIWADPNSILLSESLAIKLFGSIQDAVGQMVTYQNEVQHTVSGIFLDVPKQSSERFDFLLSYDQAAITKEYLYDWGSQSTRLYLVLNSDTDIEAFNAKIYGFIGKHNERKDYRKAFATKYSDHYLYDQYENGVQVGGRITYVRFFSLTAALILVIACINFMNLSTARASRKLKEIGVKKIIGAHRGALALQYLVEAIVIAFISLCLAYALAVLLIPSFNGLTGKQLNLSLSPEFLWILISITLISGILSGSYPALYLSGLKPLLIFKGKLNNATGELWTRKGLVVIQFAVSTALIVFVLVIYHQVDFIQNKSLGYNKDQVLHFAIEGKMKDPQTRQTFLDQLNGLSGVVSASCARVSMAGDPWGVGGLQWPGQHENDRSYFQHMIAYYDVLKTLDIQLLEGREFSPDYVNENTKVIFNEAAIKYMGLEDPIGTHIKYRGQDKEIIGVVKDFHFRSLHEKITPMMINFWDSRLTSFMIKIEVAREREILEQIETLYTSFNPGFLLDYRFLDDNYQEHYQEEQRASLLSRYFAMVAILISCLGLFGLAVFTAERRIKEIGIRKVMGASIFNIVEMLSGDFSKMVGIAVVISIPSSYFLAREWLDGFAYRIGLQWWYFAGAGLITLFIAWLAVSWQTMKVAHQNPTKLLRSE